MTRRALIQYLAVITASAHEQIIETVFVNAAGLDQQRYRHLGRIAKKQWQSGKPVKGEPSSQQLWRHVRRMNEDAARHQSPAALRMCAPGTPAACCSSSACAKSRPKQAASRLA